jgi:Ca2+-binding EF-hand superfamily protein
LLRQRYEVLILFNFIL